MMNFKTYEEWASEKTSGAQHSPETCVSENNVRWMKMTKIYEPTFIDDKKKYEIKNNMIRVHDLYFDNDILLFLNYDDMNVFINNIKKLKVVGKGADYSTVFEIINEKDEKMFIALKNNVFYKYENKIVSVIPDINEDDITKNISDFNVEIEKLKIELDDLDGNKEMIIDNDTMELLMGYKEKIKNYYDDIVEKQNNIDVQKDNLELMMETEILKL